MRSVRSTPWITLAALAVAIPGISPSDASTSDSNQRVIAVSYLAEDREIVSTLTPRSNHDDDFAGVGFVTEWETLELRPSGYTFRVVDSVPEHTELYTPVDELANLLTEISGIPFDRGADIAEHTTVPGEISVGIGTPLPNSLPCDLTQFIGCGAAKFFGDTMDQGWVTLRSDVLDDPRVLRAVLGHEVGHTMGLKHFAFLFHGRVQLMHPSLIDLTLETYRDGDIRGIRHVAGNGLGDPGLLPQLPPSTPTKPSVLAGEGTLEAVWSVVDNGTDIDEQAVELEITGSAGTTTETRALGTANSAILDSLPAGTSVRMRVRSHNAHGWGTYSPLSTAATILCPPPFIDVASNNVFCADVEWAADNDVAGGFLDGTFKPTRAVSRQAMAGFLRRVVELVDPGSTVGPWPAAGFSDVPGSNPFSDDIDWLKASGVGAGFLDGTFGPTAPVSRQAMAAFLRKTAELVDPGSTVGPWPSAGFSDVPGSNPFSDDIDWLKASGVGGGFADGTYKPANSVSRQAMTAFLHSLADLLAP